MPRKPVNNFVVYAFYRDRDDRFGRYRTVYYIGKGKPNRPYQKSGRVIKRPKDISFIEILHKDLDEDTAFEYEKKFIQLYGRADAFPEWGILRNLTNGGEGCSNPTQRVRNIISKRMSGQNNPRYGLKGPLHNRFGITHTQETINTLSKFYDWYHPDHGEQLGVSTSELARMFLDQELDRSALVKVALGKENHHKRWVLLENKNIDLELEKIKSKRGKSFDWYHLNYGKISNLSCAEMVLKFQDQALTLSGLSKVSIGKAKSHKGWILYKNQGKIFKADPESKPEINGFNWIHNKHGVHLNLSCSELIKKFPELGLQRGRLSYVSTGKSDSHKGWKIYNP